MGTIIGPKLENRIYGKEIDAVADLSSQIVLYRSDLQLMNEAFKSTYAKYSQTEMSCNLRNVLTALAQNIAGFCSFKKRLLLSDLYSIANSLKREQDINYKAAGDILSCAVYNALSEWQKKKKEKRKEFKWEMNHLKKSIDTY